jgi:D-alanine-D-alanine ligase
MGKKNVVVAFGGRSPEHEVSVLSAMQAISALRDTQYDVIPLYISKSGRWFTGLPLLELENYQDLNELQQKGTPCTFSFDDIGKPVLLETEKKGFFSKPEAHAIYTLIPAFHGSEGEDGSFQGACQMFHIPYGGSGVFASSLGMDKVKAKAFCREHGVPVVDDVAFSEGHWKTNQSDIIGRIEQLEYPMVVKPVTLGSSIGVMKANSKDELIDGIETAFRYDEQLLVEKAVHPLMEINCSVLGSPDENRASVCEQPLGQQETLSFSDKYQSEEGGSKGMASADRIIPADIPDHLRDGIQKMARQIFTLFGAAGVARLDFLIQKDEGTVYFNEINTIPGSFSFYLWEEDGMNMKELMLQLIDISIGQHRKKAGRIRSYETNLLSEKAVRGIKGSKGDAS